MRWCNYGVIFQVSKEEFEKNSNLKGIAKGIVTIKDKNDNILRVSVDDPKYLSGEFVSINKGFISVRDENDKAYFINMDSEEFLSGKYKPSTGLDPMYVAQSPELCSAS